MPRSEQARFGSQQAILDHAFQCVVYSTVEYRYKEGLRPYSQKSTGIEPPGVPDQSEYLFIVGARKSEQG